VASIAAFRGLAPGHSNAVATITVQPRNTPAERAEAPVEIDLDDDLSVLADQLEEWVAPLERWELQLREGHDFGRPNNVEARLLFTGAEGTASVVFRLDQLDSIQELDEELWLILEEREGIANGIHLSPNGVHVELFHIVGPPLGGTAS
jgi:hypothetical protein